jgi:TonB family protein
MLVRRSLFAMRILTVGIFLMGSTVKSLAQSGVSANSLHGKLVLTKLTEPSYPPLARQTRLTGDVELVLEIKEDGSVQSAIVVSGHPLLKESALNSAQRSQFECRNCDQGVRSFRMLYSFQLGPTRYCTEASDNSKGNQQEELYQRVIQSQNHVIVVDQPVGTCDLAGTVTRKKVRSAKRLYLWRCGFAR